MAAETALFQHKLDQGKIQISYQMIVDSLEAADLNRAEAVTAMICILGTQFNGGILPPNDMIAFTDSMCDFLNAYFAKGVKQ